MLTNDDSMMYRMKHSHMAIVLAPWSTIQSLLLSGWWREQWSLRPEAECANRRAMNGSMMLTILGPNVKQKPAETSETIVLPSNIRVKPKKNTANVWHPPPSQLANPSEAPRNTPSTTMSNIARRCRSIFAFPPGGIHFRFTMSGHSRLVAGPV